MITDVAITGLTKAMDSLKASIESAFVFAQKAEKSSLALGMSFGQASDQLDGTMKGLRGDLNERFAGAIAGLEAGLQGNTKGIARLINQQRLTGTASAKTAEAFAKMEMTLGLSREATNQLASNMVELGAEFQISTDNLVGAIDMLEEFFPAQKLAGMGEEVIEAVGTLQAELGTSMAGPFKSVMNMIFDTSMEGYENLIKLGIGNVREQLGATKDVAANVRIFKDAIEKASTNFKDFAEGTGDFYSMFGVATDNFGRHAKHLITIQDAFGQRVRVEGDQTADFGDQLSVLTAEILLPLQDAFTELFPAIKNIVKVIATNLREVLESLVLRGKELYVRFGGIEGIVEKAKEKFAELKDYITETLIPGIKKFIYKVRTIMEPMIIFLKITFSVLRIKFESTFRTIETFKNVISKAKDVLVSFVQAIGRMLASISEKFDWIPGSGFLGDMGKFLEDLGKEDIKTGPGSNDQKKKTTEEQILEEFEKLVQRDEKALALSNKTAKNTEELNRKTPDIETSPQFLDETANMLGRSIEAILGIGVDDTQSRILEAVEVTAAATTKTAEQEGSGGGPIDIGS